MIGIITTLLGNEAVQALLLLGVGWVANKVRTTHNTTVADRARNALVQAAEWMAQLAITEHGKSADQMIIMFKGCVARAFADAKFTEAERAKYAPMIKAAISIAMTQWTKAHPKPKEIDLPIARALAAPVRPVG